MYIQCIVQYLNDEGSVNVLHRYFKYIQTYQQCIANVLVRHVVHVFCEQNERAQQINQQNKKT